MLEQLQPAALTELRGIALYELAAPQGLLLKVQRDASCIVMHHASCIMHHDASCIMHRASCIIVHHVSCMMHHAS
jgi:hypothetical protein